MCAELEHTSATVSMPVFGRGGGCRRGSEIIRIAMTLYALSVDVTGLKCYASVCLLKQRLKSVKQEGGTL